MLIKQPDWLITERREKVFRRIVIDRSDTTATTPTFKHIYITSTSSPLSLFSLAQILPPNQSNLFALPAKYIIGEVPGKMFPRPSKKFSSFGPAVWQVYRYENIFI